MINKLRHKFIFLSMTAFFLVLVVIIAGINLVNFNAVVREADALLAILSENKGRFPMGPEKPEGHLPPGMSPEIPYESRYFSVMVHADTGALIHVETGRIVSVDTTQAIRYAGNVLAEQRDRGFVDTFRYTVRSDGKMTRITFLDCGRKLDAFQDFLLASAGISLLGYLVVFGLIVFFSGRILRPISESYEKQKRFITDVSHEFKTPLTIIRADADVLEMEVGESEWLRDIQKQTGRLADLTGNLVLLTRMEESEQPMTMVDFPISEIVSDTAASFQALAQTQEQEFTTQIQPLLTLRGNEKAIAQLVTLLLDNALKYTPSGGSITLSLQKQGRSLRLRVGNSTAAPIPKENLPRLFDRFYRVDPSRNSQTGGHGIGLSVAKAIVTAHGGKIQAAMEADTLQITVTLPM